MGLTLRPSISRSAQGFNRCFVQADHGAERPGNQVQLVLDDEIGRGQRPVEPLSAAALGGSVKPGPVEALGAAEELAGLGHPGERRELVSGRNQEGGETAVDGLVHGQNRQRPVAAEVALEVRADDAKLLRTVVVGQEGEGVGLEPGPAPRTVLERDRGGVSPGVRPEPTGLGARRIAAFFSLVAHEVGRRGLADPETDLERPLAVPRGIRFAVELQRADQAGGAGELVQGEQAQGVAHDDAHPGALDAVLAGVAQASKHHREGCEAQVCLRLAAAGREEEQVHGLAVRIERVREARQVQQNECELEGPPTRPLPIVELFTEALAQRARDGPVRHPERIECVLVRRQQRDAALDPVRGVGSAEQQALGRIASSALKGFHLFAPPFDPGAILIDQRPQRDLHGGTVVQCAECLHRELDRRDVPRLGLLDRSARDPRRPQPPAGAVDDVPVRRHPVTGGELGCIRVVQVGHLFVPVLGLRAAQVRSRYEGALALDFDFCLESVCEVRVVLVRFAPVHQEDGDGPGSCGDSGDACGVDGAYLRVERKAAAIGDVVVACPLERYRFRVFVLLSLPHRSNLAVIVLDRHRPVAGPSDRCADRVRVFRDQEAQAHRRREETLLRGLALLRRLLRKTGRFRHLVEVVVFVGVATLLGRRAGRNQEAGQVPVRRAHPSREPFGCEVVACAGADQIKVQGFDQAIADLEGSGGDVLVRGWDVGHGEEAR